MPTKSIGQAAVYALKGNIHTSPANRKIRGAFLLMSQYGLTMQQIMLTQSIFAACSLILEVPSGVLADWFGRKATLVIGSLLSGVGFSVLLWADTFWQVALFEAIVGVAFSLISGSDTSLAFESEQALAKDNNQSSIARLLSWNSFGEAAASLVAFVLVRYDLHWVVLGQVIVGWMPLLLSFGLTEPPRKQQLKQQSIDWQQVRSAISGYPVILALTGLFMLVSASTYMVAWLNPMLWIAFDIPVDYFGLLWAFISLTVAFSTRFSSRLIKPNSAKPILLLPVLLFFGYAALISSALIWVVAGAFLIAAFRGLTMPTIKLWVNRQIGNEYRATVNSLITGSFRVSSLVLGPVLGLLVDHFGAHYAAFTLIVLFVPASIGLLLLAKGTRPAPVERIAG
ncbi:MAG: MFS transporter [Reinekea sp.]